MLATFFQRRWSRGSTAYQLELSRYRENIGAENKTYVDNFLRLLRCDGEDCQRYAEWYIGFLDFKIRKLPFRLTGGLLSTNEASGGERFEGIRNDVFKCLGLIAVLLDTKDNLAIAHILDELKQRGLIKSDANDSDEASQLVFICFGFLTFLYTPKLDPERALFQTVIPQATSPRSLRPSQIEIGASADLTMKNILKRFCDPNDPLPMLSRAREDGRSYFMTSRGVAGNFALSSPTINFYTLSKLIKVRIIWTESATRHLELDTRNKWLYMFCHPSFCAMVCTAARPRQPSSFLDRFFRNFLQPSFDDEEGHDSDITQIAAVDFYKEILSSFRIIFGQDKKSWKAYSSLKDRRTQHDETATPYDDPLLDTLCKQDWREQGVYYDVAMDPVKISYQTREEFPFLGKRLLELQDFVLTQNPVNWRGLWRDRRNTERHWTFWAVIAFGLLTFTLGLLQSGLQAAQLIAQLRQTHS